MTEEKLKSSELFPWDESERCVACGMCLPHCPTYRKRREETESPRGRISLMRAMVNGDLQLTDRLQYHLDLCLSCRACEVACPSAVQYGELIDGARAVIRANRKRGLKQWLGQRVLIDGLLTHTPRLRLAASLLRFYQISGLGALLRGSGLLMLTGLRKAEAELPSIPAPLDLSGTYPADGETRGRVGLFTGCIASVLDLNTLESAITVLNRLGWEVAVPAMQTCCGALHQHGGELGKAAALATTNIATFLELEPDHIVYAATGCGVVLTEYDRLLPESDQAKEFQEKLSEITDFISRDMRLEKLDFSPMQGKVSIHEPCSSRNVLKVSDAPAHILGKIPGLECEPLDTNQFCCGAAGVYHLTQPEMSAQLLADKVAAAEKQQPDVLVSTNIGCVLHISAGFRAAGHKNEVLHPVTLLARQLREIPPTSEQETGK